jgi:hypothetical protein
MDIGWGQLYQRTPQNLYLLESRIQLARDIEILQDVLMQEISPYS